MEKSGQYVRGLQDQREAGGHRETALEMSLKELEDHDQAVIP